MIVPGEGHPSKNVISLLQCLLEKAVEPEHQKEDCGTNDCPRCEFDHWRKQLEAAYKPKPSDGRAFPMLDEPRAIPWELGAMIWETLYEPLYHDQSLARLAERGGFGWEEVKVMVEKCRRKGMF